MPGLFPQVGPARQRRGGVGHVSGGFHPILSLGRQFSALDFLIGLLREKRRDEGR